MDPESSAPAAPQPEKKTKPRAIVKVDDKPLKVELPTSEKKERSEKQKAAFEKMRQTREVLAEKKRLAKEGIKEEKAVNRQTEEEITNLNRSVRRVKKEDLVTKKDLEAFVSQVKEYVKQPAPAPTPIPNEQKPVHVPPLKEQTLPKAEPKPVVAPPKPKKLTGTDLLDTLFFS
jgi:hypothetical protein